MTCKVVKLPGGETAIVCHGRGRRPKRCACGGIAVALCDFEIDEPVIRRGEQQRRKRTCDKPLCARCRVVVGKNVDYCRNHPAPAGAQLALF